MTTTEKQTPPECCPVDIVLALKAEHAQTWRDKNDHFWLAGLVEEVLELTSALEGRHKHAPEVELTQIAAIALNWLELRALRTGATLHPTAREVARDRVVAASVARRKALDVFALNMDNATAYDNAVGEWNTAVTAYLAAQPVTP